MTQLVKINAADYGLEETKAKQISEMFKPMLDTMESFEDEFNEVQKLEINEETCKIAKELRLRYVKVRTGTAKIHTELKAFYLQGGRFVDGWKNAQLMASQGIEDKLSAIEKHYENIEKERVAILQEERELELAKYQPEYVTPGLGEMPKDVYDNFISGVKLNFEAKEKAAKEIEEARIKAEKVKKLHDSRSKEIIHLWKFLTADEEALNFGELSNKEYKDLHAKLSELKKADDTEQLRIRNENIRLEKEAKEKERLDKIEEEKRVKAEQEKAAKIQSDLAKGDKAKFNDFILDLEALKTKYEFKANTNKSKYRQAGLLIDKIINHIK